MTLPAISVVMSVYNGQAYLAEAVESILNQTFRDFEFIIIDDGSTDKTAEILSAYAAHDARIRIHRQGNKGRTASLNIGISHARADYVARMDADDISLSNRFQRQFDFLQAHPDVGVLGGGVCLIDQAGSAFDSIQPPICDPEIRSVMFRYNPMWHPAIMMRKDVLLGVGAYRVEFDESEDYDLFLRMSERSKMANVSETVLLYRIHSGQVSVRKRRHQLECLLAASAAADARRTGRPDPIDGASHIDHRSLKHLRITDQQIRNALKESYTHWIRLLKKVDEDAALACTLQLARDTFIDPEARAQAFLAVASADYRKGRTASALAAAARAVRLRPSLAPFLAKRGLARIVAPAKI